MLTFSQLKTYFESSIPVSPKSILVEYLQYELLDSIYKQKGSQYLSFMGGTAIRIGYNGNRFSEDLDFDNFGLSFHQFQALLENTVIDMKQKGFEIEFRLVQKMAFHCYVKFPRILYHNQLSEAAGEKILVRVDALLKIKRFEPRVFTINRFDIYRDILINPVDIILTQKLIAILGRKREKGRDFYDVSFLYGITNPNFNYLEQTLNIKKDDFIKELLKKCESLNFERLARDVEPFLMKPERKQRVVNFKEFITEKLRG